MDPSKTATGGFTVGYRRIGGTSWQESLPAVAEWTAQNGFGFVDIGRTRAPEGLATLAKAGLTAGQVDLFDWGGYQSMVAPDSDERRQVIAGLNEHIEASAAAGAKVFFTLSPPLDMSKPPRENFGYLVEAYAALVPVLERTQTRVAIEGWPGMGSVCCTPETYRAFFKEVGSDRFGVNYDPSHLIRLGVDPLRFLKEFTDRVVHVHAKDTARSAEELYEYGWGSFPVLARSHGFGGGPWRYTLPGHGEANWHETFRVLAAGGYQGLVSIELEDENFNGSEAGEKRGLIKSREYLEGC